MLGHGSSVRADRTQGRVLPETRPRIEPYRELPLHSKTRELPGMQARGHAGSERDEEA